MTGRLSAARIASALGLPGPTDEQAAVIEHPYASALLVVAGAGSGKTETMAARVVWLVANRFCAPEDVLGLTFTRKAAAELGQRVTTRLARLREVGLWTPTEAEDQLAGTPTISTYHAYAARLVREHALRVGREPESRLLSEAASWQFANEVVAAYDGPLEDVGRAESTITNAVVDLAGELAEHLRTPAELGAHLDEILAGLDRVEAAGRVLYAASAKVRADLKSRRLLIPVLQRYDALKRERGALDFADQMSLAADLATRFPEIGTVERDRFRAVLLDEFQDTSHAQMELLTALFAEPDSFAGRINASSAVGHSVTAVGDPNQSIYAWRGASAGTLAQFPLAFATPGDAPVPATVLPLSTTWRNDERILDAANTVSEPLRAPGVTRVPVAALRAAPTASAGRIDVARLETIEDEANAVAGWVQAQLRGGARDAAVLCRKRSQFAPIIEALTARGLPFEVVGLGGLLLTPEVQDVVALLSVAHDAGRGDRLMRLLTGPSARLGIADLDRFHAWARRTQRPEPTPEGGVRDSDLSEAATDRVSLIEALVTLDAAGAAERAATDISETGLTRLREVAAAVARLRSVTGLALDDLVGEAERALGLDVEVLARPGFTPAAARAHLDAFADVAATFAMSSDRPTLGGFLAWLDAALEEERGLDRGSIEVAPGAVHVLTVHAAKGLEWDAVAIPGLVEATFPAHGSSTSAWDTSAEAWGAPPPKDGAWTTGIDSLPYDLRGDVLALPGFDWRTADSAKELESRREQFRLDAGEHAVAEERRLAYVALTRARHRMLLTAHVWGSQKTPRVVSRFLTEILQNRGDLVSIRATFDDPPPDAANPRLATPVTASWPSRAPAAEPIRAAARAVRDATDAVEPTDVLSPRIPVEVELLLRERRRAGNAGSALAPLGRHLATSDLVALAADPAAYLAQVRRPMPMPPTPSTRRGTAFHAWVERHYRQAALLEPDDLPGSADPGPLATHDLGAMIAAFEASPWASQQPVDVELAVETVLDGVAVRGRIDAVFTRPGGGFTIVDWKSGAPPHGRAAVARAVQLSAYRLAYARLAGLDEEKDISAAFYYASTGETVYPELVPGAELVELIRAGQLLADGIEAGER